MSITGPDNNDYIEYLTAKQHPVIGRLEHLAAIMKERGAKYTDKSWRDNFDYVSTALDRFGIELTPAQVALTMAMVKEARIHAARVTGREDFADDMLEDSWDDMVNYLMFYVEIKKADGE